MDAVKFIKECRRMYKVTGKQSPTLAEWVPAADVVKEVEDWSAAHPRKTRQSVFLEQFPNTPCMDSGAIRLYPCQLGYSFHCDSHGYRYVQDGGDCDPKTCLSCREAFWNEPVK